MERYGVLFVDDDPHLLEGLRRSLREMRNEWRMAFATSGAEALELLEKESFDVVVSDMRMPGMSGSELLEQVRQRHPECVRIILSGYSDQESILRTIGPAHQYLAKPCDKEVLIGSVHGALRVQELLSNTAIRSTVTAAITLPSLPRAYTKLVEELSSENASAASVAAILEQDIALTAETLKLTNSAYFGLSSNITNLRRAVQFLGFETIKAISLVTGLYRQETFSPQVAAVIDRLSVRSVELSLVGKAIAQAEGFDPTTVDLVACSTVLCHVGTLILVSNWPDRFAEAMALVEKSGLKVLEAERQVFGVAHPELGAYLLGLWGFNSRVVEAVAYHHEPAKLPHNERNLLSTVYAAQGLPYLFGGRDLTDDEVIASHLDVEYLTSIGTFSRIPDWIGAVRKILMKGEADG